jgi:tRNA G10  N-methylase Trm11
MKYFFVLGRNPELSIIEIFSYVKREGNSILSCVQKQNSAIIEFSKPLQDNTISKLGGVISIGQILCSGKLNEVMQQLEKQEIYFQKKNNFSYVILNFATENALEKISRHMKKRFKLERLKASEKGARREMSLQGGGKTFGVYSGSIIDEQYFLFMQNEELYFGRITEKCDYEDIEKRDMKKPVRREELSISPRLAKIMINLSGVQENQSLLDPFCGIGVILQEALLQNINVRGVDNDIKAISGAKQNLEWFGFPREKFSLIAGDSKKISLKQSEVLVTEPDFGEILKKIPSIEEANRMQKSFEQLMISVLNNTKKQINKRMVFTAPLINVGKERLPCNIAEILRKTSLKIVKGFPISDFRNSQIVGREIYVLEH